jgi:nucleoside phosphorylase
MTRSAGICISDLCVVTAVDVEFKIAARLLKNSVVAEESRMKICRGNSGKRQVTVLQSELGAAGFAERLSSNLAHNRYDALIVAGLAGGLDPELEPGDAVLYDFCYDGRAATSAGSDDRALKEIPSARDDFASIAADSELSNSLYEALGAAGERCFRGPGVTASRVIIDAGEKLTLRKRSAAAAVDMETYQVLEVCSRHKLRGAALRVVSDGAGCDIPDFNLAYEAGGRMNARRLALALAARPLAAARLMLNAGRVLRSFENKLNALLIG